MLKQGLNIVLDGQWGSTGKGKLCGLLGTHNPILCCSSFGPNAGHTYIGDDGDAIILKGLPSSSITSKAPALVLPDSVIEPVTFLMEVELFESMGIKVVVHPRVAVVTPKNAESAAITGHHLAGTMKGTGHAISDKLLRKEDTKLAKDVLPEYLIGDTCEMVRTACMSGGKVIMEMSQGFDLSLNHGHEYPYLTSRDITTGAALNSCGCPPKYLGQVIGSIRSYPIRVGNVEGGWSGPHHDDHIELMWSDVTTMSKSTVKLEERTTVTNRVRRVFSFSHTQLNKFVGVCDPDWLFLNFAQYINIDGEGVKTWEDLPEDIRNAVIYIEESCGVPVKMIGTGAKNGEMVIR